MSQSASEPSMPDQHLLSTAMASEAAHSIASIESIQSLELVLKLVKEVPPLELNGMNFPVWERKLFAIVRQVCGLTTARFESSSTNVGDPKTDHLILCMMLWSVDVKLQATIDMNRPAREVFCALKSRFDQSSERSTDSSHSITYTSKRIQSIQLPVKQLDNEALVASGTVNFEVIPSPASIPFRACLSNLPDELKQMIVHYVRLLSRSDNSCHERKVGRVGWVSHESEEGPFYGEYNYFGLAPIILTSFQSIAVADQSFYRLCRKHLWNVS